MLSAIVRTSDGKQHRVVANNVINVEKIDIAVGEEIMLDTLVVSDGADIFSSSKGSVKAEVLKHAKDEKIIIFKKKRRKGYTRKNGHRQHFTSLRIKDITI